MIVYEILEELPKFIFFSGGSANGTEIYILEVKKKPSFSQFFEVAEF